MNEARQGPEARESYLTTPRAQSVVIIEPRNKPRPMNKVDSDCDLIKLIIIDGLMINKLVVCV
jgi:hypothetical protein